MANELVPIKTATFDGVQLDCYQGDDENDFWATREQIGRLLEYKHEPDKAIRKIHERNKNRLDKFSRGVNLTRVEGTRTVTRNIIVYNFKGLLEICRYSNQPNANAVIDFLWEIADDIRKHGMYLSPVVREIAKDNPHVVDALVKNYLNEKGLREKLEKQIAEAETLATLGRVVLGLPGSITIFDGAHLLASKGFDIGATRLYKMARDEKLLCKRKGKQWNQPTQEAIEKGLITTAISGGFKTVAMLTPKGLKHFLDLLTAKEYPLLVLIANAD